MEKRIAKIFCWASWKKICQSKNFGGLGIKDVGTFNLVTLAKWR